MSEPLTMPMFDKNDLVDKINDFIYTLKMIKKDESLTDSQIVELTYAMIDMESHILKLKYS